MQPLKFIRKVQMDLTKEVTVFKKKKKKKKKNLKALQGNFPIVDMDVIKEVFSHGKKKKKEKKKKKSVRGPLIKFPKGYIGIFIKVIQSW